MGCLFALFGGLFPRLALLILWIAWPALVGAAFNTFILPLLGIIFLPFTTLIYVFVYVPGVGLTGWGFFWVILALLLEALGPIWADRLAIDGLPLGDCWRHPAIKRDDASDAAPAHLAAFAVERELALGEASARAGQQLFIADRGKRALEIDEFGGAADIER